MCRVPKILKCQISIVIVFQSFLIKASYFFNYMLSFLTELYFPKASALAKCNLALSC